MPPTKGAKPNKKAAEPAREPTEFDGVEGKAELKRLFLELQGELKSLQAQRTQAQIDRDKIESFYDISKDELREVELASALKDQELESAAEKHRIELKVFQQKAKFLEYEHSNALHHVSAEAERLLGDAKSEHAQRDLALCTEKAGLRAKLTALEESQAEAIRALKVSHEKSLVKLRQEFDAMLETMRGRYANRLAALRDDLALRHKVELRDMEERKNSHINQLIKAHDASFAEMKRYYNDITKANLELIAVLKAQIGDSNEKAVANGKLMAEIAEENRRLADPLQRATAELNSLQADLRDLDKDRDSLRNARARLQSLKSSHGGLQRSQQQLEAQYACTAGEVEELRARFEASVRAVEAKVLQVPILPSTATTAPFAAGAAAAARQGVL